MLEALKTMGYYSSRYGRSNDILSQSISSSEPSVWALIALILAIVGAILIYFLFTRQKRDNYTGFLVKLHDFINFRRIHVEGIVKMLYLATTIFVTLASFGIITQNPIAFLLTLTLGNFVIWAIYQFAMAGVRVFTNTHEINEKLKK